MKKSPATARGATIYVESQELEEYEALPVRDRKAWREARNVSQSMITSWRRKAGTIRPSTRYKNRKKRHQSNIGLAKPKPAMSLDDAIATLRAKIASYSEVLDDLVRIKEM